MMQHKLEVPRDLLCKQDKQLFLKGPGNDVGVLVLEQFSLTSGSSVQSAAADKAG